MRQSKKLAMYELVKEWQSSEQKKSDFCRSVPINIHTFTYWVQKYKIEQVENGSPSQLQNFLPLKVDHDPISSSVLTIDLHYPNGVRLSVPQRVGLNYLTQLLQISV